MSGIPPGLNGKLVSYAWQEVDETEVKSRCEARHRYFQNMLIDPVVYKQQLTQKLREKHGIVTEWLDANDLDFVWCGILPIRKPGTKSNYERFNADLKDATMLFKEMCGDTCYTEQKRITLFLHNRKYCAGAHDQSLYFRWE